MLCDFDVQVVQEFENWGICSPAAEGIEEKMDENKKEVKSILCETVKSLDEIFAKFREEIKKGGVLHNFVFELNKNEQEELNNAKKKFPPFFEEIQKVIFGFMNKVHELIFSSKLIDESKVKDLTSKVSEEITKHKGEQEQKLKQLFLSKVNELKKTDIIHEKKLAEIEIEQIALAMAIHKSHKGMVEEVEFVLQVFSANSIYCGKVMKERLILNIFEGLSILDA
jgi:hypothetical protein